MSTAPALDLGAESGERAESGRGLMSVMISKFTISIYNWIVFAGASCV